MQIDWAESTLEIIVKQMSKLNKVDLALHYYGVLSMKTQEIINLGTLNALLECCLRNDRLDNAIGIFRD